MFVWRDEEKKEYIRVLKSCTGRMVMKVIAKRADLDEYAAFDGQ